MTSIKAFTRWLWRDGRAAGDTLAHLQGYNAETDRRRERRDLLPDEFARLIQAAERGPTTFEMLGPDRAMLYATAAGTGFRANELRTLTRESFDLDSDSATVTVAKATRRGKGLKGRLTRYDFGPLATIGERREMRKGAARIRTGE